MKYLSLLLLVSLSVISCKQDLSSDEQALYDKVMVIHDDVMPEISTINRLQDKLEKVLPTVQEGPERALVKKNLGDLAAASDFMFDWMQNFKKKKDVPDGMTYESYLQSEYIKIQRVDNAMRSSIAASQELLEKIK